jgi:hypothetical protein
MTHETPFQITVTLDDGDVHGLPAGDYLLEVRTYENPFYPASDNGPEEGGFEVFATILPDGRELMSVYTGDRDAIDSQIYEQLGTYKKGRWER